MRKWLLEEGAESGEDGTLLTDDGYGGKRVYTHPLEGIEAEEKTWNGGQGWNGWEIRELHPQYWEASFAEVFCSENPYDIADYIARCRPLLHQKYPRSRARAFVWYLQAGPLVTFYRPASRRRPVRILGRYLLPWQEWPHAREWSGTYDDLLEQMVIAYPLPSGRF